MDARDITPKFQRGDVVKMKGGFGCAMIVTERFYDIDQAFVLYGVRVADSLSASPQSLPLTPEFALELKPEKF